VDVVDVPAGLVAGHEVPQEALETVLEDLGRVGWPPDVVGLIGAVVGATEEGVEAGDVVHVQVGETKVVYGPDVGERDVS
jgi:hypothetical protein